MEEYGVNDDIEAMMKAQITSSQQKQMAKKNSAKSADGAAAAEAAKTVAAGGTDAPKDGATAAAAAPAGGKAKEDGAESKGHNMTKTMYAVSQASDEMVKLMAEKKRVMAEVKALRDVLAPQLEAVRQEIRDLPITSLYQVMAFTKPPKLFAEWLKAVCYELDLKNAKKWKVGQALLKQKDFKEVLCDFDPSNLTRKNLERVTPIIEQQENYFDSVTEHSLVDAVVGTVFSNWACSMYRYGSQIIPKKEQLRKLEKQIENAKSCEHRLAERFLNVRMKYMRKLFERLDVDKGGTVDFKELQHVLTKFHMKKEKKKMLKDKIGIAHKQASKLMVSADKDGGYVGAAEMDFEEFTSFMLALLRSLFLELDTNRNGKIDSMEVKEFLRLVYGPGLGLSAKPPKDLKKVGKKINKIYKMMARVAKKSAAKGESIEIDVDAFIDFSLTHISSKAALKKNALERLLCAATMEGGLSKAMQTTAMDDIQAAIAAEAVGKLSRFGLESVVESNDVAIGKRDGDWVDASLKGEHS